jgi:hypothetical protein
MPHEPDVAPLSQDEIEAETAAALPAKEVISLLDLNADIDAALDLAAPIDLAVAANANVAAPIDAAVAANVLSVGSDAQALADQGVLIDQHMTDVDATAAATQDASISDSGDAIGGGTATDGGTTDGTSSGAVPTLPTDPTNPVPGSLPDVGSALDGDLLNVDVNVDLDADLTAPVAGGVAANAQVAAPIDAAAAANIGTVDSTAVAVAQQDAIIDQSMTDVTADAEAEQSADVNE